jgi:hypothetical protein
MSDLVERLKRSALDGTARHRLDAEAADHIEHIESEAAENARIIAMSGEREARLLARIAELERELSLERRC